MTRPANSSPVHFPRPARPSSRTCSPGNRSRSRSGTHRPTRSPSPEKEGRGGGGRVSVITIIAFSFYRFGAGKLSPGGGEGA